MNVRQFTSGPKEPFVVTLGRFSREKNYELVNKVAEATPDASFFIVGRKEDQQYYERISHLKPRNVTLLCDLPSGQLVSLLSRAKVYLHTMVSEHFGISIVEAMASGCVPVAHDSGGAREILGKLGYVYKNTVECVDRVQDGLTTDAAPSTFCESAARFDVSIFRRRLWAVRAALPLNSFD